MGLSIHYSGKLKPDASLRALIEDVTDVSKVHEWKSHIFSDKFPQGEETALANKTLYGVSLTPIQCETIFLTFAVDRRLVNPVFWPPDSHEYDYNVDVLHNLSVKTQFAGTEVHMIVIGLFKYLSKKYFEEFELSDEGRYWETGNEQVLKETFHRYGMLIDMVKNRFENTPAFKHETIEQYIERVLKQFREKDE